MAPATVPQHVTIRTADEFLAWAECQIEKYEFERGTIVAITAGRDAHPRLALRIAGLLDVGLGDRGCRVYNSDFAIKLANEDVFRPDVMVACSGFEDLATTAPLVVIEILSPTTESKWRRRVPTLQAIPSLAHIIIVHQMAIRIEHYTQAGQWKVRDLHAATDGLVLPELGLAIKLDDLYRGIVG